MQMTRELYTVLSWVDKMGKPIPVNLFTMPLSRAGGKDVDTGFNKRMAFFEKKRREFLCEDPTDVMIGATAYGQTLPPDSHFKGLLDGGLLKLIEEHAPESTVMFSGGHTNGVAAFILSSEGEAKLAHYRSRRGGF